MKAKAESREQALDHEAAPPVAEVRKRPRWSWMWLAPLAALGVVSYLFYSTWSDRGPLISITFETANGLLANQTKVKYKSVTLGTVQEIELSDDLSHVVAKVRMNGRAERLLREDTRFWVVRPRINDGLAAFQTGLETLVSGAYVAMDPGSKLEAREHFKGLEKPPSVRSDEPGTTYVLESEALGGLSEGAPVYYHEVQVGEVLSYQLEERAERTMVRVFVRAPFDERIVAKTRFYNVSGLQVTNGPRGINLEVNSLRSFISGGIGFRTPASAKKMQQSKANTRFRLYEDWASAEVDYYDHSIPYVSYFQGSVRGLTRGSEVLMFGKQLGVVTDVELARDPRPGHAEQFAARVSYVVQPGRTPGSGHQNAFGSEKMGALVENDLRVVLKTVNLLTSQKALSLDYVPGSGGESPMREGDALVLPSETQNIQELGETVSEIASQINSIPFQQIGRDLQRTLAAIERTVGGPELERALTSVDTTLREVRLLTQEARAGLGPALARLPRISQKLEKAVAQADAAFGQNGYGKDSTVQRNMERMMAEIAKAARSIRLLADFLNRHPEAVVTGRSAESP